MRLRKHAGRLAERPGRVRAAYNSKLASYEKCSATERGRSNQYLKTGLRKEGKSINMKECRAVQNEPELLTVKSGSI